MHAALTKLTVNELMRGVDGGFARLDRAGMAHDLQPRKLALGLKIHPQSFLQSPRIRAIRSLPAMARNPRLVYRPNHQLKAASKGPG